MGPNPHRLFFSCFRILLHPFYNNHGFFIDQTHGENLHYERYCFGQFVCYFLVCTKFTLTHHQELQGVLLTLLQFSGFVCVHTEVITIYHKRRCRNIHFETYSAHSFPVSDVPLNFLSVAIAIACNLSRHSKPLTLKNE